jgi:superfamily II DNA or RNA helicase
MNKDEIQQQIVESLPNPCHGILRLSPRIGKTKIGIDVIKKEKPKKILWVTPNTKLRDKDIPAEFKQWKALSYFKKTDIICYASLANHSGNYDKIYLDELQDLTSANAEPLFNGNIKYKSIVGLTGTLPKHKEKQELYDKLDLKILTNMSIDEAVENGLIAPYKIKVIECRLNSRDKNMPAGNASKPFMQTEEARYGYLTRLINAKLFSGQTVPKFFYLNRMRFLYNLKSKNDFAKKFVSKLKGRTLVFAGGIEQAENICKNTYHSKTDDKDLQAFLEGKINTLACVNAGGVGFTYRDVNNFVIVQVNSDNKGDATQKIARSLVLQEGYVANIYILCVINTVDEDWKNKVLLNFNKENIEHISYVNYE